MAKQYSKNLEKVQSMVDGTYGSKIQSGYDGVQKKREVGDIWTDSDGVQWEQKEGYRSKINKLASVGIFKATCKDCEKGILKNWDKDTHKADGRCYHCQLNYEMDLKFDKWIRWFAYRRLKELKNMVSIENDLIQWIDEREKMKQEKIFDMSVANAMANANVEMSIKKNS
jgi:hypothetical protein